MPVHLALNCAQPNWEVVNLLLNLFPDAAQLRDRSGWLPLHFACNVDDAGEECVSVIQRLLALYGGGAGIHTNVRVYCFIDCFILICFDLFMGERNWFCHCILR